MVSVILLGTGHASGAGAANGVRATQPAPLPAGCVAHSSFSDGGDVAGDYRCAGLAVDFHTAGVGRSPGPIWAGQWLFRDDAGRYRRGTCTFNRGTHPTASRPSHVVAQPFPNDPGGVKAAYLAWRYGETTDPMTAAAMWAVFHHYALDAAGSNRSADPSAPLVPRLDRIAASSGRADLQAAAIALDAEARRLAAQPWQLGVAARSTAGGDLVISVALMSGDTPVPDRPVMVLVSGDDVSRTATTGEDGTATVTVPFPPGPVTVAATTEAPGPVLVYRGTPASPNPLGAQTLAVAGAPRLLRATASLAAPPPPTTLPTTTVPPTTVPPTTVPPTTVPPTTVPPTTTIVQIPPATTVALTVPPSSVPATVSSTVPVATPLPRTGRGTDSLVAWLATAFLVGGAGLLGTIRRRRVSLPK